MSAHDAYRDALQERVEQAFLRLDTALVVDAELARRRPAPEAWSVAEIAEHVHRADHNLLLLAGKLARKARDRAERGEPIPRLLPPLARLEELASDTFAWSAPENMLPRGELDLRAARRALAADRDRCRVILHSMPAGAGVLASARFSPLDTRFDAHQYLALVALHAERHARQALRTVEVLASAR
ncbi:MAG: DinB family protein [Planctomycetes bacterium]|nr:DinB family protein [Planctomycetota bacterium]